MNNAVSNDTVAPEPTVSVDSSPKVTDTQIPNVPVEDNEQPDNEILMHENNAESKALKKEEAKWEAVLVVAQARISDARDEIEALEEEMASAGTEEEKRSIEERKAQAEKKKNDAEAEKSEADAKLQEIRAKLGIRAGRKSGAQDSCCIQ